MIRTTFVVLLLVGVAGCGQSSEPHPLILESDKVGVDPETAPESKTAMTNEDLDRIEHSLKLQLPAEYRRLVLARGSELSGYTYTLRGQAESWIEYDFFDLKSARIISENLGQRSPSMAAGHSFPGWWKEYFLLGSNGGGDYYVLRLNGTPGVSFMACDAGEIRPYADSLQDFVDQAIERYQAEAKTYTKLETLWQAKSRGELGEAEFDKQWQAIIAAEE